MKPIIIECEQRTPEWFAARAGRLTGSVAADMLAKLKSGGEPAARRDLKLQLAVETLTGTPMEASGFVSPAMQRGIDAEPLARGRYEAETGNLVRTTGFVIRDDLARHLAAANVTPRGKCFVHGDLVELRRVADAAVPHGQRSIRHARRGPGAGEGEVTAHDSLVPPPAPPAYMAPPLRRLLMAIGVSATDAAPAPDDDEDPVERGEPAVWLAVWVLCVHARPRPICA